jgi:uncharacterized membrane protein
MSVEINTLKHGRQRHRRPATKSLACQRGAIGILGASVLLLSVLFTALAVDTGRLMLEQRRLQKIADMAALDASSQSGSCGDGTLETAEAAAIASALRNNHPVSGAQTLDVALGNTLTGDDGVRSFIPGNPETAMSVEVIAGNSVPASLFAGGIFGEQATLQASAVAERLVLASFSAGSGLLSLNSRDSALLNLLLGEILGSSVSLDLVSYQGIAATNVTLLELVDGAAPLVDFGADVGTVDELLKADLNVAELLEIYANAVDRKDVLDIGIGNKVRTLITAKASNLSITLGDILAVTAPNVEEAASASVNLLDLITTTALVANGKHALTLPLSVNLGKLLNVITRLEVTEPPKIAIGPPGKDEKGNWRTQTKTAQVRLETTVKSDINLGLLETIVDLALRLEVARGSAWLQSIQCRNPENGGSIVTIGAQPGIASIDLGATDPDASAAAISVKLLGSPLANIAASLHSSVSPSETELIYDVDANSDDEWPMVQRASSGVGESLDNGLGSLANRIQLDVNLLGLNLKLGELVEALLDGLLRPLLAQLGAAILDPLLRLLGIKVGYLDVRLFEPDIESHRPTLLI